MTLARIAGVIAMALCSFQASAAGPGFYFGVTGGRAEYDFDKLRVPVATLPPGGTLPPPPFISTNPRLPPSATFTRFTEYSYALPAALVPVAFVDVSPFAFSGSVDHDDADTSWSALVGYRISDYFAAEVSYAALGELTARNTLYVFPTFAPIQMKYTLQTQGPTLMLLGNLPVTDSWDIYIRAGGFFLDSKLESTIGASRRSTTFGTEGFVYGFGTQYNFGEHWSVRLDAQRYNTVGEKFSTGEADIDNVSLGVLYRL